MGNRKLNKSGIKVLVGTFLGPFIQVGLLFISAGRVNIPQGWFYLVVSFIGMFGGIMLVYRANPELLNHRGQWEKKKDTKPWDKVLLIAFGIVGFYILPVVIGLDIRFQWSYLGIHFTIAGIVMFLVGSVIINWAMMYKIVRHPGYVGAILWIVAIPLIIGSIVGLIPTGIAGLVLIIRTWLEDKTLHSELNGYVEYAGRVKYRLFPGIW
ncbi:MAG: methyltransferase family protein [Planctomycetota bacterium]|jgi:protein-S-isoprenylcysteine O-methyltransferase Ste14